MRNLYSKAWKTAGVLIFIMAVAYFFHWEWLAAIDFLVSIVLVIIFVGYLIYMR